MIRTRADGRKEGRLVIGHKHDRTSIFLYFSDPTEAGLMAKQEMYKQLYKGVDLCEESNLPLENWLDRWLEEFAAPAVRPTTLEGYRNDLNNYVKPYLGKKPIRKITTADIQKLYREVQEHGRVKEHPEYGYALSASTIRSLHGVLHQAMEAAVAEHLTAWNPTEGVTLPTREVGVRTILNNEQLNRFLEAIGKDEWWTDFFYTEITTGLRQGEICGLKWSDFDQEAGTLTVRRTVHEEKGGGITLGEPKTSEGNRTILLPPSTAELLENRRASAESSEWIFPNTDQGDQPLHPQRAYRRMKKILKQAGLPDIRFHDLRHTFATHALSSGVDAKTLSTILGHTKPSFTLDNYTHMTGDMQQKAADLMDGLLDDLGI